MKIVATDGPVGPSWDHASERSTDGPSLAFKASGASRRARPPRTEMPGATFRQGL